MEITSSIRSNKWYVENDKYLDKSFETEQHGAHWIYYCYCQISVAAPVMLAGDSPVAPFRGAWADSYSVLSLDYH